MDKEIIIDGVNVAECEFYCDGYCTLSNDRNERLPFAEKCNRYSDCIYKKQLQRKKQGLFNEKQAAQIDIDNLNRACLELRQELEEREQECEKLKKQEYENLKLIRDYFNRVRYLDCELDHYKQVLEKIEEICEHINCKNPEECYMNKPDYYGEVYGCEPDDWKEPKQLTKCPSAVARAILKIINEVKDDNRN